MTASEFDQALEWADRRRNISDTRLNAGVKAAAELILSLPDTIVDGDKLREIIDHLRTDMDSNPELWVHVEALEALLPALPTLEDMDEDARHALIGKDVKVEGWNNPSMLIAVHKDEGAVLGHNWINPWPFVEIRPLSELTPVNEDAPTVAEQENVTPDQAVAKDICGSEEESLPRPEDAPPGQPWIVEYEGLQWTGVRKDTVGPGHFPWMLTRMDGAFDDCASDIYVTLISRLVPETR